MQTLKTVTLTVRLTPEVKATLREAAAHERRSLANMLEVMIRAYSDHPDARSGQDRSLPPHGFGG